MDLFLRARDLGIQTEFIDGQGHPHVTAADALKVVFDALPPQAARALLDGPVVMRQGHAAHSMLLRGGALSGALGDPWRSACRCRRNA